MTAKTENPGYTLSRDTFGRLMLQAPGADPLPVRPVHSFPITHREEGLALIGPQGQEVAWISHLADLPEGHQRLINEELAQREFHPLIQRIRYASSWTTPSRWEVDSDRGATHLILNSEDDIRRLSATALLIADSSGVHFVIRDVTTLDKASRRILDHFL
ncbi:MAG: DUF1854 domain-containing protein [Castellaniella sp.]|uniref:cyanophycin metabolism-associated DUF1854 family protein n=1 Tax=Castellaniella sp. TaxID=1955812 RepID=UPI0012255E0F|nr:DUF1854 domain-containing protein [Castellaniella sp.]TAN28435.1 MAG: DUF1854 domain-containing protein [Castellaniella sp.]